MNAADLDKGLMKLANEIAETMAALYLSAEPGDIAAALDRSAEAVDLRRNEAAEAMEVAGLLDKEQEAMTADELDRFARSGATVAGLQSASVSLWAMAVQIEHILDV